MSLGIQIAYTQALVLLSLALLAAAEAFTSATNLACGGVHRRFNCCGGRRPPLLIITSDVRCDPYGRALS